MSFSNRLALRKASLLFLRFKKSKFERPSNAFGSTFSIRLLQSDSLFNLSKPRNAYFFIAWILLPIRYKEFKLTNPFRK